MMKKITIYLLIFSFLFCYITPTNIVNAKAKTLRETRQELKEVENNRDENNRITEETAASIDRKRNAIASANRQISSNEKKVEDSKTLVAESQEKIKIKTEELKDVINILQYSDMNDSEIYVDYIFEATSITEMIERQAIVEQIIDYTKEQLDSLEDLVDENEKLQVKLNKDNVNLNNSITQYEKQVDELEAYIDSRAKIGLNYEEQIKTLKRNIKNFEAAGCKEDDDLDKCYYNKGLGNSAVFMRPLSSGRVSQAWGNNGHKGIDLAVPKGTKVYAPANGTVITTAYKQRCGGNEIYIHYKVGGKAYTGEFAHLTSIKVKPGDKVKQGQVIATTGGDSSTFYYDKCTTGAHLHYSIAYGYYLGSGTDGYKQWSTFLTNTKATSVYNVSKLQNKKGWTWSSR